MKPLTAERLAIAGGTPVRTAPFPPWPVFAADEIEAVERVVRSGKVNYWTGTEGREFEKEFAAFIGTKHAVALANGTVALELALYALGIGPGDEVIVPCRTFIASASCAVMRGARPVVVDIDPDSQNVTAATIEPAITPATKAIIVVHLAGWPCNMTEIMALAGRRGLLVIEDCAQALGARWQGRPVGSWGHAAAFSFCQDKILTTLGEGGMLVTNDPSAWERAWQFKDHGKSHDAMFHRKHPPGFRWVHEGFGTNWRMLEVQSAQGRVALRKVSAWVDHRRRAAAFLNEALADLPALRLTLPPADAFHAYYKYYAFLRPERLQPGWTRDRIQAAIAAEGIPCLAGSCGDISRELAFRSRGWTAAYPLVTAPRLFDTSLMFLVHPTGDPTVPDHIQSAIRRVLATASR